MKAILLSIIMTASIVAADQTVYIGTRTRNGRSEGLYRMKFNPATGALHDVQLAAATVDPSFVALHPSRPWLYAVLATPEGKVQAFRRQPDGSVVPLNTVSSKGAGPAHLQVDRTGRWLAVANYTSGSVAVLRIEADGTLSEAVDSVQHEGHSVHPERQTGPHAHAVNFSADNRHLYVPDLGLDEVKVYGFDVQHGKLTAQEPLRTPKGAGPRHLAFGQKRIYVLNEIASTVSVFENGNVIETVGALPEGFTGTSTAAEVELNSAGTFLYASNRGADTIAVFRVGGHLTKVGDIKTDKTPRHFALSPDGHFLLVASQDEDTIQAYRVDDKTGLAAPAGEKVKAGSPICLVFANTK